MQASPMSPTFITDKGGREHPNTHTRNTPDDATMPLSNQIANGFVLCITVFAIFPALALDTFSALASTGA
jgi:hypothetical protein